MPIAFLRFCDELGHVRQALVSSNGSRPREAVAPRCAASAKGEFVANSQPSPAIAFLIIALLVRYGGGYAAAAPPSLPQDRRPDRGRRACTARSRSRATRTACRRSPRRTTTTSPSDSVSRMPRTACSRWSCSAAMARRSRLAEIFGEAAGAARLRRCASSGYRAAAAALAKTVAPGARRDRGPAALASATPIWRRAVSCCRPSSSCCASSRSRGPRPTRWSGAS